MSHDADIIQKSNKSDERLRAKCHCQCRIAKSLSPVFNWARLLSASGFQSLQM